MRGLASGAKAYSPAFKLARIAGQHGGGAKHERPVNDACTSNRAAIPASDAPLGRSAMISAWCGPGRIQPGLRPMPSGGARYCKQYETTGENDARAPEVRRNSHLQTGNIIAAPGLAAETHWCRQSQSCSTAPVSILRSTGAFAARLIWVSTDGLSRLMVGGADPITDGEYGINRLYRASRAQQMTNGGLCR